MEIVKPELIQAVGELPIIKLCLLVIFAQFFVVQLQVRDLRREISRLAFVLERVLIRFEDWLDQHDKE